MTPGDVCLISLPQAGGGPKKLRPALLLSALPGPYQNVLLCGISTQLHALVPNWDEYLQATDADFASSGLKHSSIVRLSFLYAADANEIVGVIGSVDPSRLRRLLQRLSDHLKP